MTVRVCARAYEWPVLNWNEFNEEQIN